MYISNRSDQSVHFDNLKVKVAVGNLIEENHYYAYGLKIASISSVKLGDGGEGGLKNNNLYNDKELIDDADLNWYDYGFRNYDPQIGRFPQLDPLTDEYPELTPYQYASDEPITNVDRDGLELLNSVGDVGSAISHVTLVTDAEMLAAKASGALSVVKSAVSVAKDAGAVLKVASKVSLIVHTVNTTTDIINKNATTKQIGNTLRKGVVA